MASARPSKDWRQGSISNGCCWGAECRSPVKKPRLDGKARAPSTTSESLGRKVHASARRADYHRSSCHVVPSTLH